MTTTVSLNITENQMRIMLEYAKINSTTINDLINKLIKKYEDELDAKLADEGIERYLKYNDTMTHEEVLKELGFK
jgi:hypothetical protein